MKSDFEGSIHSETPTRPQPPEHFSDAQRQDFEAIVRAMYDADVFIKAACQTLILILVSEIELVRRVRIERSAATPEENKLLQKVETDAMTQCIAAAAACWISEPVLRGIIEAGSAG